MTDNGTVTVRSKHDSREEARAARDDLVLRTPGITRAWIEQESGEMKTFIIQLRFSERELRAIARANDENPEGTRYADEGEVQSYVEMAVEGRIEIEMDDFGG